MEKEDIICICSVILIILLLGRIGIFIDDGARSDYCELRFGEEFYKTHVNYVDVCQMQIVNESTGEREVINKYYSYMQFRNSCERPYYINFLKWNWECEL